MPHDPALNELVALDVRDGLESPSVRRDAPAEASGLPVSFTASPSGVCTVSGNTVHLTGVGMCTIIAQQAGDANYSAATLSQTFSVLYQSSGLCSGDAGHQILQPINADSTSVFKQGSTVPAKFRVCNASGVSVGTPGVVLSFNPVQISDGTITVIDALIRERQQAGARHIITGRLARVRSVERRSARADELDSAIRLAL